MFIINNNGWYYLGVYLLCGAVLPVLITLGVNKILYAKKKISFGDMALSVR
ncbi:hypothetical protein [Jeotgalibaca porci]|uniref:hypothetical protein n=1 Tax=Jeotgalibaca porci TaxID=1868793 RepID=UPI00359FB748